jgi:hypothetical protein
MNINWYRSSFTNSSGGAITTTALDNSDTNILFPSILQASLGTASTTYRKVFLRYEDTPTWVTPKLWILFPPTQGGEIAIGLGTAVDTDGSAIMYSSPATEADGISLPTLSNGESVAVWIRRTIATTQEAFSVSAFQLVAKSLS